jgi:hypothetical protein
VNRAAEAELDVSSGQLIEDVAGIRQRAGEPVQFRHHEGVARSTGGERQPKTWPVPVRARQAVVDLDAVVADPERVQPSRWAVRSCCSVDTRAYPTSSSFIPLRRRHWRTKRPHTAAVHSATPQQTGGVSRRRVTMGTTTRRPVGATPGRIQGISVSCVKLIGGSYLLADHRFAQTDARQLDAWGSHRHRPAIDDQSCWHFKTRNPDPRSWLLRG